MERELNWLLITESVLKTAPQQVPYMEQDLFIYPFGEPAEISLVFG